MRSAGFAARTKAVAFRAAHLRRNGAASWSNRPNRRVPCSQPVFPCYVAIRSLFAANNFPVIFPSGARLHAAAPLIKLMKTNGFFSDRPKPGPPPERGKRAENSEEQGITGAGRPVVTRALTASTPALVAQAVWLRRELRVGRSRTRVSREEAIRPLLGNGRGHETDEIRGRAGRQAR
jgi:hypothetical protein